MLKLLGAVFILLATTWAGFETAKHISERPRQLRQLKVALQALEAEIMYAHTPLKEAAATLSKQMPKPLSWFFEVFSKRLSAGHTSVRAAWENSLQEVWRMTAFKQGEYEIMKQFGETLAHLEREEADALDRQSRYEKMLKSLGFLSGLLLVILLM